MGNGYNHHLHHHNLQKSAFLPMLCSKPSIKDVVALSKYDDHRLRRSPAGSISNDPLSPKVGCMGQVKRSNRIMGFPTSTNSSAIRSQTNNNNQLRYLKLKRLFSGKYLLSPTTTTTTTASTTSSCSSRKQIVIMNCSNYGLKGDFDYNENYTTPIINVAELDPPLPVVKKVQKPADCGGGDGSLWRRRSGGVALKSLQIQQIHHIPNQNFQATTV